MDLTAFANQLIDKYYTSYLGVYDTFRGGELAVETAGWILQNRPDVAYAVLSQLQIRGFASSDIIRVARGILDAIPQANLNSLALTPDGNILIRQIGRILKYSASGNATSQRSVKIQTALDLAKPIAKPTTSQPRQLTQVEIDYYIAYLKSNFGAKSPFNTLVCWQLPRQGDGYVVYKPDDLSKSNPYGMKGRDKINDLYGYDQIGTKETVENMMLLAKQWFTSPENPSKRLLQIGDMSRPGGVDTPDHGGHQNGQIVDMRAMRKDAIVGDYEGFNYRSSVYDLELTKKFIRFIKQRFPNIFIRFNDDRIAGKEEFTYVHKDKKGSVHDDHLHLEFR